MEVLSRHVTELPIPPRQRQPDARISEPMERLILRALEKEPARRPQTAEQFRDELLAVPAQARSVRVTTPSRSATPVPAPANPAELPRREERVLWIAAPATAGPGVLPIPARGWGPPRPGPVAPSGGGPPGARSGR